MSESATEAGRSLEQILWAAVDRVTERPALVDEDEFAERIAGAFLGDLPAEKWVERFYRGNPELREGAQLTVAQAVAHSSRKRMHVYEFDLNRLEYVVLQEEDQFVVVSDFGQFALPAEDKVVRAIESATVPSPRRTLRGSPPRSEPRAYLVRADGRLLAVDPEKLASALARLDVRQKTLQAVAQPMVRLESFQPQRRAMTRRREQSALQANDPRLLQRLPPPPPRRETADGLDDSAIAAARPSTAEAAVFVLLPDGSLARPEMGAATRWREMVSGWSLRAGLLSLDGPSVGVSGAQRFTVSVGKVTALFTGSEHRLAPGGVGTTAAARGEGVVAARADLAPVRVLSDDELAHLVVTGNARLVGGWTAPVATPVGAGDRFWIQPEATFAPTDLDRRLVSRSDVASGLDAPAGPQLVASRAQPLQLGQVTGDPWADWDLQVAGAGQDTARSAEVLRARETGAAGREVLVRGEPIVAFRAPDGILVTAQERPPVPSAAMHRDLEGVALAGAARGDAAPPGADRAVAREGRRAVAPRSGALPATTLAALQLALQRTASASGYKLPAVQLAAAPEVLEPRRAPRLPPAGDWQAPGLEPAARRRPSGSLAGPVPVAQGPREQLGRLVLSMPFPDRGEVHVGGDLSAALAAYLRAPVVPAAAAPVTRPQPVARRDLAGIVSTAGLPPLLQRAIAVGGAWRAGPGAAVSLPVQRFASLPLLPLTEPASSKAEGAQAPAPPAHSLGLGEDEIVIPMPLWAQMGLERMSATHHVPASAAAISYLPPLGSYRLVAPPLLPGLDAPVTPPGTKGRIQLSGPAGIRLVPDSVTGVHARVEGSARDVPWQVPIDDGTVVSRPGRIRIGAPIDRRLALRPPASASGLRPSAEVGAPALPVEPVPLPPIVSARGGEAPPPGPGAVRAIQALPPGAWSGESRFPGEHVAWWSFAGPAFRPAVTTVGAVDLTSLSRPQLPPIPAGLRFRYLWRSILVPGAGAEDLSGGMDRGHDGPHRELSFVSRRLDVLATLGLAGGGAAAAAARGPETAYVAMDEQGRAGAVSPQQLQKARRLAQAVDMRIVTASPPSPPPLESMSSAHSPAPAEAPQPRQRPAKPQEHKGADDAVSLSKIEGSVDAIAQRIYHRIRRRLASDRERFGG